MKIDELCEGCNAIEGCLVRYHLSSISKCPCIECLVKVACTVKCFERAHLFHNIPDSLKVIYKRNRSKGKYIW